MEYEYNEAQTIRLQIVQDDSPYDVGDMFSEWDMPDATPEERETAKQGFLEGLYRDGGPWGFIVEEKCGDCGSWLIVDSCFGFDKIDRCYDEGREAMLV